jgi:hypothetical protein
LTNRGKRVRESRIRSDSCKALHKRAPVVLLRSRSPKALHLTMPLGNAFGGIGKRAPVLSVLGFSPANDLRGFAKLVPAEQADASDQLPRYRWRRQPCDHGTRHSRAHEPIEEKIKTK